MPRSQGGQANKTGNVLEQVVISALNAHDFVMVPYREYEHHQEKYGKELVLRNVPYTTLYGGRGYTEFLILSERYNVRTRIECKWQQGAGSVDEKLPYTYLSCAESMDENDIIILIDGKGFRDGAVDWLRNAAEQRKYIPANCPNKHIRVMNTTEFLTWCNNTFR